jgi:hypothetical protein
VNDITLYTEDEAAALMKLRDRAAVRRLRRRGDLGCVRLSPKCIRISAAQIAEFIDRATVQPAPLTIRGMRGTLTGGNTRPRRERRLG